MSVNLWHGMPVKRIGWMSSKQVNRPRFTYELAASEFWRPIVAACMRPRKDVLVTGLPRCDRFSADDSVAVRRHLGGEAELCSKLVVWLPTYRHTERGDPEADGIDFHNEAQMPGFDPEAFESWLTARNIVCVIKPHPLGPRPRVRATGPLRIMDDEALGACGLTLYGLLGGSDALLTDVSSVYVDYLLLNRPVIHAFADREAYGATRGYTFDWTEDYFAGPVADTMAGVQTALEDVLAGRDTHAARRARLRELFHARPNDPAAASLLTQLGLKPAAE
ncbi:MAG TPA: CDP-glycerol glycerophosphotransferase family protein [Candidatus Hydrogenedentes bacterium]|nr:CDP-glycerol glycerophosphotransferase family protein [Candidatus Hydrogenedentota bacterium]